MRRDDDDESRPAPPTVVAAVAVGTAPVPFLAIYAVLFLVHGSVHPVVPPDITDSQGGEFLAGVIAFVVFLAASTSLLWAIGGRRRWPFVVVQAGLLATAVFFLVDGSKGGTLASIAVLITCAAGLVLILLPQSWPFYGHDTLPLARARARRARRHPAGSAEVTDPALAASSLGPRPRRDAGDPPAG